MQDATPGMSAYEAGIGPGMKLVAVDGRRWTRKVMEEAIRRAKDGDPPAARGKRRLLQNARLDYHDGPKYPHLVRDESKTDLLTEIITSRSQ